MWPSVEVLVEHVFIVVLHEVDKKSLVNLSEREGGFTITKRIWQMKTTMLANLRPFVDWTKRKGKIKVTKRIV